MRWHLVMFLFVSLGMMACKQKGSEKEELQTLRNGYSFKKYTNNPGIRPRVGEVVTIDFDIIDEYGNILSDSRNANVRPTVQMPASLDAQMLRNPLLSLIEELTAGDSASVFVPVDSLSSPPASFLQSEMVEYRVVVRAVESQDDYMKRIGGEQTQLLNETYEEAKAAFDKYMAGDYDDITVEKNGEVKLAIVNEANGVKADFNELVFVHYYGFFRDGSSFDNSYKVAKPYGFRVGSKTVIQGWDIAIPDISEGSSAIIDIPYTMAYGNEGKKGTIPPKSDLIYWVKIDQIEKSKKVDNN